MDIKPTCPVGKYRMNRIECTKTGAWCPNQRFKPCVGWFVNTDFANDCPMRKEQNNDTTGQKCSGRIPDPER